MFNSHFMVFDGNTSDESCQFSICVAYYLLKLGQLRNYYYMVKWFVKGIKNDCPWIAGIRGKQGYALFSLSYFYMRVL